MAGAIKGINERKAALRDAIKPYSRAATQAKSPVNSTVSTFQLNKVYGQHLLKNPAILDAMIEKAQLKSSDTVLEIGSGTGNLTMRLLPLVKRVVAIEVDPRMVAELQRRVASTEHRHKLTLILGDAIKTEFPYFDVCLSNTPYQISSPLTFKLLSHRPIFREAFLMFQREFALRLVAEPADPLYCRLSINTQLLCKPTHVMKIGKNNFRPPPKVESSIISLKPYNPPPPVNFLEWDGLVRIAFSRKNKTMKAIFKKDKVVGLIYDNYRTHCSLHNIPVDKDCTTEHMKKTVLDILEKSGLADKRSNKMNLNDFLTLLNAFNSNLIHFT
ncbi:probable dimethyladenosine transferase [Schistocerca gregaria]|uniref:probable dimethyladenosine transferase n=1 Tax=Schistocerca gregaria TaxID=7010 RepID=UPI00211DD6ED|nr:probable dimethyladenosine transferase [Schistocerca gregaria]